MPELPEVETTLRGIVPHIKNLSVKHVVLRRLDLRWPIPQDLTFHLVGEQLLNVTRRSKYLVFHFPKGHMLIHLGMSGSLRLVKENDPIKKHDHADIIFEHEVCLRFHDPRRFGAILWLTEPLDTNSLLSHLGPEPLSKKFYPEALHQSIKSSRRSIKQCLMDAKIVVGVGNIYASEALFIAKILPLRPANKITPQECCLLVNAVKHVLKNAIDQGGTTLRDFVNGQGQPGYFSQQLTVYGRDGLPCTVCGERIKQTKLAQRSTYYCPACQI